MPMDDDLGRNFSGGSAESTAVRGGDNPGFGTGGNGSVGGGGGYGGNSPDQSNPGGNPNNNNDGGRDYRDQGRGSNVTSINPQPPSVTAIQNQDISAIPPIGLPPVPGMPPGIPGGTTMWSPSGPSSQFNTYNLGIPTIVGITPPPPTFQSSPYRLDKLSPTTYQEDANEAYKKKMGYVESKNQGSAYNKSSGAFGEFQFLKSTALGLMKKNHPDMVAGMTDDQINRAIALNQGLQNTLIDDFNRENEIALKNSGIAVNDTNKYMAHWFGAGGADDILSADPNTPIENILSPEAIKNNRLTGMTTGEVAAKAASVMANAGKAVTQNALEAGSANKYAMNDYSVIRNDATEIDGVKISNVSQDVVEAVKNKTLGQHLDDAIDSISSVATGVTDSITSLFDSNSGKFVVSNNGSPGASGGDSYLNEKYSYGPYENLSQEEYREQYGGSDQSGITSIKKKTGDIDTTGGTGTTGGTEVDSIPEMDYSVQKYKSKGVVNTSNYLPY